ncbi:MAG: acyl-CoA/acyl-ACP dehydrogenase [Burkholderiaceae bacterium]|nr:acyl-CoA/acyl-ACP dehydrogenase [Burkholderiaceae bacterium]MEB2351210.1 acyl-CoA/acyl-ACP dehydrogenase [Burkholderiaceae bacterium]
MPMLHDFGLTEEQKMMRESLLRLATRTLPVERIRGLDRDGGWPTEAYQALAKAGWLGLLYPEKYGGMDGSYMDLAVLLETLSYHYACLGTTYMTSPIYAGLQVLHHGSEQLRQDYLVPMLRGELYFAFALTEPQTGSDAAAIKTHAIRSGDEYVVRGQKWFITSAHVADWLVVVVKTDPKADPPHKGFSLLFIDARSPGVTIRPIETLGRHTTHTNQIFFDDVRVPARNLLGEENRGWKQLMRGLNLERVAIAACGAGNAQKALEIAQDYATQRMQFGQPISKLQVIAHKLADMRIKAEVARLVTYRTAEMMDAGHDARMETAIAKVVATENDFQCADIGMQVMGGAGYSMEHDMQRLFRDSRLGPIGGGSNEIQRNIIGKLMGL